VSRIGIGIVTYNRLEVLKTTIDRVRRLTLSPSVDWVVADDGSSDGTIAWLRANHVPMVGGVNMGIAWNKNRALFLLSKVLSCATIILLEDDTYPTEPGWETPWVEAVRRWGHINLATPHMEDRILSGAGTPEDPFLCPVVTGQCTAFSRESLLFGGYLDSRFKGYGYEHGEHSRRLVRAGYGGIDETPDMTQRVTYRLIRGALALADTKSYFDADQVDRNLTLAADIQNEQTPRAPWRSDAELRQFRTEMDDAIASARHGFALRRDPAEGATEPVWGWRRWPRT
jgi:glycosyltransferase involved in cell wall biosynthesis